MAVYTVLTQHDIEGFLSTYDVGYLVAYEGITAGLENTNYFITTQTNNSTETPLANTLQHFVLTLFEEISTDDLSFYITLTTHLSHVGLPVPSPIVDKNNHTLHTLKGKPAVLIPKLTGTHPINPTETQCAAIGKALSGIHLATLGSNLSLPGSRNLDWLEQLADQLRPCLDPSDVKLLDEIPRFKALTQKNLNLPQAIIHGDLFRDNALYQDDSLMGIIDFNSAGSGYLMLDLAVTVNDWCSDAHGNLIMPLVAALLNGYQQKRPLSDDERHHWNDFLRIAATRFWLSRLAAQLHPLPDNRLSHLVEPKDPHQYKTILLKRITNQQTIAPTI